MATINITHDNVTEIEPHKFCTEASSLGLKPGEWPTRFETTLGNGLPLFIFCNGGDGIYYRQQFGCIQLVVFND